MGLWRSGWSDSESKGLIHAARGPQKVCSGGELPDAGVGRACKLNGFPAAGDARPRTDPDAGWDRAPNSRRDAIHPALEAVDGVVDDLFAFALPNVERAQPPCPKAGRSRQRRDSCGDQGARKDNAGHKLRCRVR
jgi:hypothetical protein